MVSSFALHHRNERTLRELLRIHPDEHPVSIQLFGHDPEVMRSGGRDRRRGRRRPDRPQHGLPGAQGAARPAPAPQLLREPDLAVAVARGARRGRRAAGDGEAPLRARARRPLGLRPRACGWPRRPASRRSPSTRAPRPSDHKGSPDYALARELAERVDVPVIISGGSTAPRRRARAYEESGADAVMIARGSLGNPWIFEELTGRRGEPPAPRRRSSPSCSGSSTAPRSTWGAERAARYLRKFYPWYLERLGCAGGEARTRSSARADLEQVRELLGDCPSRSLAGRPWPRIALAIIAALRARGVRAARRRISGVFWSGSRVTRRSNSEERGRSK